MASSYPGSLDTFATTSPTNLGDDDSTARNHAERHDDIGDAVNKIEAELGTDPAGTLSTVAARLTATEWGVTKTQRYATGASGSAVTGVMTANKMYGVLYPVAVAHSIDRIVVQPTTGGSAGSVIRLGVYKADANGADYTLVLDAGTVDGTTTGALAITIDQALTPGMYWLVAVGQGSPSTQPTIVGTSAPSGLAHFISGTVAASMGQSLTGLESTATVSGALPSTDTPTICVATAPRVFVRIK